jgi:hypothetical protein
LIRASRMKTNRVRVRVVRAAVCPAISEIALFSDG